MASKDDLRERFDNLSHTFLETVKQVDVLRVELESVQAERARLVGEVATLRAALRSAGVVLVGEL